MNLNELLNLPQYSLGKEEKSNILCSLFDRLNHHHFSKCAEFKQIVSVLFEKDEIDTLPNIPFIPVSAFKNFELKSISQDNTFKVLTSSGTTGQRVSRIYLDKETAKLQALGLSKIITHVVGNQRLPMLIIDSKSVFSNKLSFSARGAGILGLSVFGKDHTYVLDDKFELDEDLLTNFLDKHNGKPILIFGFTFMVWEYFYKAHLSKHYDLSKAVLIHSGGWKKLVDISVDNTTFRRSLLFKFGINHIFNFYGMVEQVGSVFLENSDGNLQCPNFADVIIRDPVDLTVQKFGEPGLIQVLSLLPQSYPGHSLLTEDIGILIGEDDATNGWKGKHFRILGRAKKAELRGCSDTFKIS